MSAKNKRYDINNILKLYQKIFPVLEGVYIKIVPKIKNSDCIGRCNFEVVGKFIFIEQVRYKHIRPKYIELTQNDKNIIFTLLHELAHAITPHYEKKVDDRWTIIDHSDYFYDNYLKIMNIAYENNIINKKYTFEMLKKDDTQ